MHSANQCNNPTYLCGSSKCPVSREYRALNGKLGKLGHNINMAMVPCLHQGNIYTKRKQRLWRDQKCIRLVGAITPLTCADHQNTPSRRRQYRAQNRKLGKLGWKYGHGTVLSLTKYLYQKEATGMERPETHSANRCNNTNYLYGPSKYPVSREAVYGPERKVG